MLTRYESSCIFAFKNQQFPRMCSWFFCCWNGRRSVWQAGWVAPWIVQMISVLLVTTQSGSYAGFWNCHPVTGRRETHPGLRQCVFELISKRRRLVREIPHRCIQQLSGQHSQPKRRLTTKLPYHEIHTTSILKSGCHVFIDLHLGWFYHDYNRGVCTIIFFLSEWNKIL